MITNLTRIPQFKPALQQARYKHGVAKTPNASVSKSFLTLAPNERQFRSDDKALMIDVHSEAETYWLCYRMLVPRALNHRQLRNLGLIIATICSEHQEAENVG